MVKNKEQADSICSLWLSVLEQAFHIPELFDKGDLEPCIQYMGEMSRAFELIYDIAKENQEEEIYKYLMDYVVDAAVSLDRIKGYVEDGDLDKAENKIEFELIPILRAAYAKFYYYALIYPDKDLIKEFEESGAMHELLKNYYVEESYRTGEWKYDLSVMIVGYNKLSYTKQCVESFLENKPEDLKYELILYNHGSTDGTKDYFESIQPDKQVDLAKNSNLSTGYIICEGRYMVIISNDIIVTPNALNIMYEAISQNKKVAWAVPSTSNVSNLQVPYGEDIQYNSREELYELCRKRNIRNIAMEEERVRLCNPISIYDNVIMEGFIFKLDIIAYISLNASNLAFPDDILSLLVRRYGYKSILLRDVYCHHFGSVTIGKGQDMQPIYAEGRKKFYEQFGVDPWDESCCYDYELFSDFKCDKKGSLRILGINAGFGSNPLKIKEVLKENGTADVMIDNINLEPAFDPDLEAISDRLISSKDLNQAINRLNQRYDYILFDRRSFLNKTDEQKIHIIKMAKDKLKENGIMILHKDININIERLKAENIICSKNYYIISEWGKL